MPSARRRLARAWRLQKPSSPVDASRMHIAPEGRVGVQIWTRAVRHSAGIGVGAGLSNVAHWRSPPLTSLGRPW